MAKQPSTGRLLYEDGVRVFVVLDFDGVLNTFPDEHTGHGGPVYDDFQTFDQRIKADGAYHVFRITWSASMVAALNDVLGNPGVQLCWLTSWRRMVLKPAQRMGFAYARPPVVIPYGNSWDSNSQTGKPAGLIAFLKGVPAEAGVVWCDDSLNVRVKNWATYEGWERQVRDGIEPQLLPIGPYEETGISRSEMSHIHLFVNSILYPQGSTSQSRV